MDKPTTMPSATEMLRDFYRAKKAGHKLRERKGLQIKPNGRSADFIIPSYAVGCELACSYCYVARHRAFGNPLELMTNKEAIWQAIKTHYESLPQKESNQVDPYRWVYDIGESSDCLTPALIETTRWFLRRFWEETEAKPSFATKISRVDWLEDVSKTPYRNKARVRISLMPPHIAKHVERGTSRIESRLEAFNALYERGYEVHVNFSPVIAYDGWMEDYRQLFKALNCHLSPEVKQQLKTEVIFLTHQEHLHSENLKWLPDAENLLWTPSWQEGKTNLQGDKSVLRYRAGKFKRTLCQRFEGLLREEIPECSIRYIF